MTRDSLLGCGDGADDAPGGGVEGDGHQAAVSTNDRKRRVRRRQCRIQDRRLILPAIRQEYV